MPEGIAAAIRLSLTNARAEALNTKVRLIVRHAYGFHAADAVLALVMLAGRPANLCLPFEAGPRQSRDSSLLSDGPTRGPAPRDRVGPGREPDSSDRHVRTFGADRDFAGALPFEGR
jgi:hypothetical protein